MQRQRDPWEPFRLWLALTIGLYAIRAFFAAQWPGAIPGWVLLVMVLVALALASKALLFPGRVIAWRQGDGGWWHDLRDDWGLWWQRRSGNRPSQHSGNGPSQHSGNSVHQRSNVRGGSR